MKQTYKIGFIGTGGRSCCYAKEYVKSPEIEIVALADPCPEHRQKMARQSGITSSYENYDNWQEMLDKHTLDGVVISSPNHCHADQVVACLKKGIAVALEKPIATTVADCERIIAAERLYNGQVLVGFVLRSTPFYVKVKELISSGALGRITSVQADELPGLLVSAIMHRSSWRRYQRISGGSMLEKCCHDLDIFNWLLDSYPLSLNSYGGNRIFTPNPMLPDTCDDCNFEKECHYYNKPKITESEKDSEEYMFHFISDDSRCIYNIDNDIMDVQSVAIEYANGTFVNFMMNFNCLGPKSSRNFHVIGTKGRIWGNIEEHKLFYYDNAAGDTQTFDTGGDGSGHGGGDKKHAMELLNMMKDRSYKPEQNAYAGYLSAVMCFAADISVQEKRRVTFNYNKRGNIEII